MNLDLTTDELSALRIAARLGLKHWPADAPGAGHRVETALAKLAVRDVAHSDRPSAGSRALSKAMTVPEYAAAHNVSPGTIRRRAAAGKIPAERRHGVWLIEAP